MLKPPSFAVLSSDLKHIFFMKKNIYIDHSSSLPYLIDINHLLVNWLIEYISCKVIRKKKAAANKWLTLTIGKIKRKSIKKFIYMNFGKNKLFYKSSKQDGCYLVLLRVQYRSSHFWIVWKTLSLHHRPEGKRIISNLRIYTTYWYKTKKNWWRYFDKIWKIVVERRLSP